MLKTESDPGQLAKWVKAFATEAQISEFSA